MTSTIALVLASHNRGKLAEFAQLLTPHRVTIYPLSKFIATGADETGTTFCDNALFKARYASQIAGLPAIADDSGLEVDALDGAPGIYSARYADASASDQDNNRKLLAALTDQSLEQRSARFRCVLAYVRNADDPAPLIAEGVWEGRILNQQRGINGFGYDSVFLPNRSAQSVAEMTSEDKNAMSHRSSALRTLVALLIAHGEISA